MLPLRNHCCLPFSFVRCTAVAAEQNLSVKVKGLGTMTKPEAARGKTSLGFGSGHFTH